MPTSSRWHRTGVAGYAGSRWVVDHPRSFSQSGAAAGRQVGSPTRTLEDLAGISGNGHTTGTPTIPSPRVSWPSPLCRAQSRQPVRRQRKVGCTTLDVSHPTPQKPGNRRTHAAAPPYWWCLRVLRMSAAARLSGSVGPLRAAARQDPRSISGRQFSAQFGPTSCDQRLTSGRNPGGVRHLQTTYVSCSSGRVPGVHVTSGMPRQRLCSNPPSAEATSRCR